MFRVALFALAVFALAVFAVIDVGVSNGALPQGFCYRTEAIASRWMLPKSGHCLTMGVTQIEEAARWTERSVE